MPITFFHIMSPYITLFQNLASTVLVRNHPTYRFSTVFEVFIIAVIPVTVQNPSTRRADTDIPFHPSYKGTVLFKNTFDGQLAATDYPKVNVCLSIRPFEFISIIYQVLLCDVYYLHRFWSALGMVLLSTHPRAFAHSGKV